MNTHAYRFQDGTLFEYPSPYFPAVLTGLAESIGPSLVAFLSRADAMGSFELAGLMAVRLDEHTWRITDGAQTFTYAASTPALAFRLMSSPICRARWGAVPLDTLAFPCHLW